jgi:hypothetical protein
MIQNAPAPTAMFAEQANDIKMLVDFLKRTDMLDGSDISLAKALDHLRGSLEEVDQALKASLKARGNRAGRNGNRHI